MNQVVLMGRLTRDPDDFTPDRNNATTVVKYTLAIDRIGKDAGADFIRVTAFGAAGDFAKKYFTKGLRVLVTGRIQTGSYEGEKGTVWTTDVIVDRQEFADGKKSDEPLPWEDEPEEPAPPVRRGRR